MGLLGVLFGGAKAGVREYSEKKLRCILWITGLSFLLIGAGCDKSNSPVNAGNGNGNSSAPVAQKTFADGLPAQVGRFTRKDEPKLPVVDSFPDLVSESEAVYAASDVNVRYNVRTFKSPEAAKKAFETKKQAIKKFKGEYQHVDDTAARFSSVWLKTGEDAIYWVEGKQLNELTGADQKNLNEFEGILRNKPPVEVVEVKLKPSEPVNPNNSGSSTVTVGQLLEEYKNDSAAADKKYKGKEIVVSGKVEVSEKNKSGKWMIGFMKPGSTEPKDGMVICGFDKSQEAIVSSVKKGDSVKLRGKVTMNLLTSVMMENCSKF